MFSFFKKHTTEIPASWERMENWLSSNAPHLLEALNPPASTANIAELETAISAKLPTDYIEFLQIHNGQDQDSEGLIDVEEVLSTERILDEWKVWKSLLDSGEFGDYASSPEKGIKSDWYNDKWIPITYDGSGNHFCIDLDPAAGGKSGQIIRMWHDGAERELIASSFDEWFATYVQALENGAYIYSEDWGGIINKADE